MGNCLDRCFGRFRKRKYLRTRYNIERDISIEFENLMDEEQQNEEMTKAVTEHEKALLRRLKFEDLVKQQKILDSEIDKQLIHQEEELRLEEEAYYEAKREAARVAKLQRQQQVTAKQNLAITNNKAWAQDDDEEWNVAGGEDDFELFLENVKARSLAARTRVLPASVPVDMQSESSSQTKEQTEASSLDLEWEPEAGLEQLSRAGARARPLTDEQLSQLSVKHLKNRRQDSNDLEWEQDYADRVAENARLLADSSKTHSDEEYMDR